MTELSEHDKYILAADIPVSGLNFSVPGLKSFAYVPSSLYSVRFIFTASCPDEH